MVEFRAFPKIPRLSREIVITEKIDGTNAQVFISDTGDVYAGSRTRWITPESDNFGFARWVDEHREELLCLGAGCHYGEWWGSGIQRGYGLKEKVFSLFNTSRWVLHNSPSCGPKQVRLPSCCNLVPVLYQDGFDVGLVDMVLWTLRENGSVAAPGFMKPEGIVIFHSASGTYFKKTIEKDDVPKTAVSDFSS